MTMFILIMILIPMNTCSTFSGLNMLFNWDNMSSMMTLLVMLIMVMIFMFMNKITIEMFSLLFILLLSFNTKSLLMFFIYYELSLIPMISMILKWGTQPERLEATTMFVLYTFMSSIPMYMGLIVLYKNFSLYTFMQPFFMTWEMKILLLISFMVKLPMWPLDTWLQKAHVESPTEGSMILASLLLKLGSYGLYRIYILSNFMNKYLYYIIATISIIGMLMSIYNCINTNDMKILIACSSVCHMSPVMMISTNCTINSFDTITFLSISHGICSSMMFFIAGILSNTYKTRLIMSTWGLMRSNPIMASFMILMMLFNLAIPPLSTFIAEMFCYLNIILMSVFNSFLIMFACFVSSIYNMLLWMSMINQQMKTLPQIISCKEMMIFLFHLFILLLMLPISS